MCEAASQESCLSQGKKGVNREKVEQREGKERR